VTNFRFLLIDEKDRRGKIENSVETVVGESQEHRLWTSNPSCEDTLESTSWIAFVHRNDLLSSVSKGDNRPVALKKSITDEMKKLLQQAAIVIAYTGGSGGLSHQEFVEEARGVGFTDLEHWYCINKGVDENTYDEEGMKEIVRWSIDEGRSYNLLPRLLRPNDAPQYLHSLRVMLEIFLAANVDKVPLDGTKTVDGVPAKLGFSETSSKPVVVKETVRDMINSLANWRTVFQGNLTLHAKNEWTGRSDFSRLENLLQKVDSANSQTLTIEDATEAYGCLAKELKR